MTETVTEQRATSVLQDIPQRTSDSLVIVGFADSRRNIPTDGDHEYWGMNGLHRMSDVPDVGWTRWFDLHDLAQFYPDEHLDEHLKRLRQFGGPVYLRPQDVGRYDLDNAVPFPINTVLQAFGLRYYTNTVSWLVALAILMEFKELRLHGVDMAQDGVINAEYQDQRPSVEAYLGIAMGAGMTVHIPPNSDLLKASHLYGFEDPSGFTGKAQGRLEELNHRKQEMKQRMAQLDQERQQLVAGINQLDGACQDVEFWLRNWTPNPAAPSMNGNGQGPS